MRAFVIDAFTDTAFRGNPAGVVLLDAPASPEWMQHVAAEFKHSETAFVSARADGSYDLRWFTPAVEVELCGHATLATTHALSECGAQGPFAFRTASGVLRTAVDDQAVITMDFPALAVVPVEEPDELAAALGERPVATYKAGADLLVELVDADAVRKLVPDLAALAAIECRGVVVTALLPTGPDADFVSRFFGPRVGVPEDPVTGSAHCALGPFWAARLGRDDLTGLQASPRGGRIGVRVRGDRVLLRGAAVTVLDGHLRTSAAPAAGAGASAD